MFTVEKSLHGEEIAGWQGGKNQVSTKRSSKEAREARKSVGISEVETDFVIIRGGVPTITLLLFLEGLWHHSFVDCKQCSRWTFLFSRNVPLSLLHGPAVQ